MGVAFRELPVRRSQRRLAQSRDRGLQGSAQCGYCVHWSHLLLPTGHDRLDASTPGGTSTRSASCRLPPRLAECPVSARPGTSSWPTKSETTSATTCTASAPHTSGNAGASGNARVSGRVGGRLGVLVTRPARSSREGSLSRNVCRPRTESVTASGEQAQLIQPTKARPRSLRVRGLVRRSSSNCSLCARGDLNPHVLRHWNLNPARLPIPPLARAPHSLRHRRPVLICRIGRRGA